MDIHDYDLFEQCVVEIFSEAGYLIQKSVKISNTPYTIDFVAEADGSTYYVEVKYSPIIDRAIQRIYDVSETKGATPILVTAYELGSKRERYNEQYPNLILIDIANLLFAVKDNIELRNRLISILPFTIESIEPKENFLCIGTLQHNDYTQSLIEELRMCQAGRPMARTFEVICKKMLENIFSDDLALWKEQQKSNKDLYRFDLLCRIKDGNQKAFWSILERFFNSKYIVFEFKNYGDAVTQKEIYTTEKYLYAKALRSVAIIIAANGYKENARWAAKGSLRENGKLIILLDTEDLIKMNQMKTDQDDPADYLMSKLDDLLLELEK